MNKPKSISMDRCGRCDDIRGIHGPECRRIFYLEPGGRWRRCLCDGFVEDAE